MAASPVYIPTGATYALTFTPTRATHAGTFSPTGATQPGTPYISPARAVAGHEGEAAIDFAGIQARLEPGRVIHIPRTQQRPEYVVFSDLIVAVGAMVAQGGTAKVSKVTVYQEGYDPTEMILKRTLYAGRGDIFRSERAMLDQIFDESQIYWVDAPLRTGVNERDFAFSLHRAEIDDLAHFDWRAPDLDSAGRVYALCSSFADLSSLYAHIHAKGFVHGDIRPENQLVNESMALPTDWGTLRPADNAIHTRKYSQAYADPLGFINRDGSASILAQLERLFYPSASTDLFAFGRSIEDTVQRLLKALGGEEDLHGIGGRQIAIEGPMDYYAHPVALTTLLSAEQLLVRLDHRERYEWFTRVIDKFVIDPTEILTLKQVLSFAIFKLQNPVLAKRPSMDICHRFFTSLNMVQKAT